MYEGPSLMWSCASSYWIYNYLCNQCLSPLTKYWVRILLMVRCTQYNIIWWRFSVTCDRSVVFCGYSGFLHQQSWPPWYNWDIESGIKHHNYNLYKMYAPLRAIFCLQQVSDSYGIACYFPMQLINYFSDNCPNF